MFLAAIGAVVPQSFSSNRVSYHPIIFISLMFSPYVAIGSFLIGLVISFKDLYEQMIMKVK